MVGGVHTFTGVFCMHLAQVLCFCVHTPSPLEHRDHGKLNPEFVTRCTEWGVGGWGHELGKGERILAERTAGLWG